MNQNTKKYSQVIQQFQAQWELAIQRAAEAQLPDASLADMLTKVMGLPVKSGVNAGNMRGDVTRSCPGLTCSCF